MERWRENRGLWLTVYEMGGRLSSTIQVLDRVESLHMSWWRCHPRLDPQTQWVYVPCRKDGVRIYRCVGRQLQEVGRLRCVSPAQRLAVCSSKQLIVTGRNASQDPSVCLVNVSEDTVTRKLQRPTHVLDMFPDHVSVLGNAVLVCHGDSTLVIYYRDNSSAGQMIPTPDGLSRVYSINTDNHSSFLVTDWASHDVFVLDVAGKLRHRVHTGIGELQDCAVAQCQLWLGSVNHVAMMMSE